MGKEYGARWRTTTDPVLGEGGQGHVYPVEDKTKQLNGTFALKRLKNKSRLQRFQLEISALERINHPNIIKILDHSSLNGDARDHEYLVMPLAKGGDLGKKDRLSLYSGAIEATICVAKQIALGLQAAHEAGVIHRDIKPENILFVGAGHELWISDFGICLLDDSDYRFTPDGEVVGPRAFLAPELEGGGVVDVTAAADIYSFGKVIYFMISGGVIIPRERGHEAEFRQRLDGSERLRQLAILLEQMICPLERRISNAADVYKRLLAIEEWEQNARTVAMSPAGLSALEQLQKSASRTIRVTAENQSARKRESQILSQLELSFAAWAMSELKLLESEISNVGMIECIVTDIANGSSPHNRIQRQGSASLTSLVVRELHLRRPGESVWHQFQVRFCSCSKIVVTVRNGLTSREIPEQPFRDQSLAIVFCYEQASGNVQSKGSGVAGYFSRPSTLGSSRNVDIRSNQRSAARRQQDVRSIRIKEINRTFVDNVSQYIEFKASEWPVLLDQVKVMLADSFGNFLKFLASGEIFIGE